MVVGDLKKMWFSSIRRIGNAKNLINLTPFNWLKIVSDEYVMTRYDSVGMTRWLEILLCLTAELPREKALNIIFLSILFHLCWRCAADKKKPLYVNAPGFDSRPWNFLAVLFGLLFFSISFFSLLTGFILFTKLPLYNFASCCVKRIFIFASKACEERIIGWWFFNFL